MKSQKVEKFNRFASPLGGYMPVEELARLSVSQPNREAFEADLSRNLEAFKHPFDVLKILYNNSNKINSKGQYLQYIAGYIDDIEPNGYCDLLDDDACIGITIGAWRLTVEASQLMFRDSVQFPDLKDEGMSIATNKESDNVNFIYGWGFGWLYGISENLNGFDWTRYEGEVFPFGSDRQVCSEYMYDLMNYFLLLHEFAHALRGHIYFLRDLNEKWYISENKYHDFSDINGIEGDKIKWWMEYDADIFAATFLLSNQLESTVFKKYDSKILSSNVFLRVRILFISVLVSLYILSYRVSDPLFSQGSHPSLFERMLAVTYGILQFILNRFPEYSGVEKLVLNDLTNLARQHGIFIALVTALSDPKSHEFQWGEHFIDKFNRLNDDVSSLIKDVSQYRFE